MATIKTSVIETPPAPKDIFTKGNLVIFQMSHNNNKFIILVDKSINDKKFSGQVINHSTSNPYSYNIGAYQTDWEKAAFTQFYGTVTIESTL